MQERVKTSFIPKASLQVERKQTTGGGSPVALINVVAGALLIIAILISAGIFGFEQFTKQSIESKKESLERSRAAFEPATIRELSRLNTRIESSKVLIRQHVAISMLFDDLEQRTLSTIRFSDFDYTIPTAERVEISMSGEATSFNAVALQSEAFSKSSVIKDPIFSDVNIANNGSIEFNFTGVIDLSRITYTGEALQEVESIDDASLDAELDSLLQ